MGDRSRSMICAAPAGYPRRDRDPANRLDHQEVNYYWMVVRPSMVESGRRKLQRIESVARRLTACDAKNHHQESLNEFRVFTVVP